LGRAHSRRRREEGRHQNEIFISLEAVPGRKDHQSQYGLKEKFLIKRSSLAADSAMQDSPWPVGCGSVRVDITVPAGITKHVSSPEKKYIVESMSGGVAPSIMTTTANLIFFG
jgi:hypothetical protein